jgi:hypothetical protein
MWAVVYRNELRHQNSGIVKTLTIDAFLAKCAESQQAIFLALVGPYCDVLKGEGGSQSLMLHDR